MTALSKIGLATAITYGGCHLLKMNHAKDLAILVGVAGILNELAGTIVDRMLDNLKTRNNNPQMQPKYQFC